jgi:hypothetical protein
MIKKVLLPFLLLLIWTDAFAQEKEEVINWQKDVKESIYSEERSLIPIFENSTTIPQWGLMPCFVKNVEINPADSLKVSVKELETDTIDRKDYIDLDVLNDSWKVKTEYRKDQVMINILPLKTEGNKIIRLKKFVLLKKVVPDSRLLKNYGDPYYMDMSVLNSGEWYKIGTARTGVYKIGYDDLEKMGVDVAALDPADIRIYGQYSGMLPEANAEPRADDLMENAIEVVGGDDGSFDKNDMILFFAQGPVVWKYIPMTGNFEHQNNLYSDTIYYFLNVDQGAGKRIAEFPEIQEEADDTITTFMDHQVVDHDLVNLLMSGKLWVGEEFDKDTTSRIFNFSFPDRVISRQIYIKTSLLARGVAESYFSVLVNGNVVVDSAMILSAGPSSRYYAKKINRSKTFLDGDDDLSVTIDFAGADELNKGWIDYLEINAYCDLKWRSGQLVFTNPKGMDEGEIDLYGVAGVPAGTRIWDVTVPTEVNKPYVFKKNDTVYFKAYGAEKKRFVVFNEGDLFTPVSFKKIENQNLHGTGNVNMVIVAPPVFLPFAQQMASIHKEYDGLTSVVVTPEQIYNEFSSGVQDVTAIRDFMRMLYLKGLFGNKPPYLLLFGDGSFDYKDRIPDNTNFIPVYESDESLQKTATYGTDDFLGLLDEDEGQYAIGDLDMGIGRFPVATEEEADALVKKINHYLSPSQTVMRDWRNVICFVADDEDLNLHLNQAESLTRIVDTAYPEFNINKIYIDAYVREKTSSGYRYPEVNDAIDEQVEKGALIMNYTGHGGLDGWSAEKILTLPQIRGYDNYNNLPLFITATCEFSRFDDPMYFSAGEQLFLNEHGGAIALFTTSRLAFAHANVTLNRRIYLNLKNKEGNELPRLGDLMRLAKTPSHTNFLNFTLLGDPALRLAYPQYRVVTESIINSEEKESDTANALSKMTVKGEVMNGTLLADQFNGYLYVKIFDKKSKYITRANSYKSIKQLFELFDKVIFDGKVTVKNGSFEFTFFVPADINPEFGTGKISYYALDTVHFIDAAGEDLELTIGGVNPDATQDTEGPEIRLYINDEDFSDGDVVGSDLTVRAELTDISGINHTGLGLGRDITLTIDQDYANMMIVNDYFVPVTDSYTSGCLTVPLNNMGAGEHQIILKAWDLQNNSGEKSVNFIIKPDEKLALKNVYVYPNPFIENLVFRFTNNKTGSKLMVEIRIYDLTGRKVSSLGREIDYATKVVEVVFDWKKNIEGSAKINNGIYLYEMIVKDINGYNQNFNGKLIKVSE